jgi:hypothetical protein
MDLGAHYSKQDNPSFPKIDLIYLDFDQRISMSLVGKVGHG